MPIHDLGYRSWDVPPATLGWRWLVIGKTGIRNAWKNKWLARVLFCLLIPAAMVGICIFFFEQANQQPELRVAFARVFKGNPSTRQIAADVLIDPSTARHDVWAWLLFTFFRYPQAVGMVMVVGLIAPRLIAQDVRSRAFLLYFSRPLTPLEYVLGKAMTIWFYLVLITTVPALLLYVLGIALSPGISVVMDTYDLPIRIILASFVLIIPTTSLALCFSSLTHESRYAGFMWFTTWILGYVLFFVMFGVTAFQDRSGQLNYDSSWSLTSLYHTLANVQQWVFGLQPNFSKVFPSLVLLIAITVISWSILMRRVTAPLRQ
jgi:ABC-2 type transport system permease protein